MQERTACKMFERQLKNTTKNYSCLEYEVWCSKLRVEVYQSSR